MHIGSDRPKLKDLYNHVVGSVAKNWKTVGVQLLRSDQTDELDIIETNHPQDVVRCCQCLLKKWLDSSVDATWNQLIKALRCPSVRLNHFASKLEQRLKPECKIIAMYLLMKYKCLYRCEGSVTKPSDRRNLKFEFKFPKFQVNFSKFQISP